MFFPTDKKLEISESANESKLNLIEELECKIEEFSEEINNLK